MNRTQLINFILNYSFQPDFLTHKHKEDILKVIVDNDETHSILDKHKRDTDIDLNQLSDNSIKLIAAIVQDRLCSLCDD
jgi:hypothetical protein